jgi:hypothetical protein
MRLCLLIVAIVAALLWLGPGWYLRSMEKRIEAQIGPGLAREGIVGQAGQVRLRRSAAGYDGTVLVNGRAVPIVVRLDKGEWVVRVVPEG